MRPTVGRSWPTGVKRKAIGTPKWSSGPLACAASAFSQKVGGGAHVRVALAESPVSNDYERKVQTSETLIEVAMIRLLVARHGRRR